MLYALAKSPRAYEIADGPFVSKAIDHLLRCQAEDGSIADAAAAAGARLAQTRAAAAALSALVTPGPLLPSARP